MTHEVWRGVAGYEGFYQVSNLGRVRSLDRVVVYRSGSKRIVRGRILKQTFSTNYYKMSLCKNGAIVKRNVHRLIAETFLEPVEGKDYVDHINADTRDNRVENLRWVTMAENNQHIHDLGHFNVEAARRCLRERYEKFGTPIKPKPVIMDGQFYFGSVTEAAKAAGAHVGNVSKVCRGLIKHTNGHTFKYAEQES